MKHVAPLTDPERQTLWEAQRDHPLGRVRQRALGVLLSERGYTLDEIAEIVLADRDTVSSWLNRWRDEGLRGLYGKVRSGRPPIYTDAEVERLQALLEEEPRRISQAQEPLAQATDKRACRRTAVRRFKKKGYRWRRCRRSLKAQRTPEDFETACRFQERLKAKAKEGAIKLVYLDESGLDLVPCVPYAWHAPGQPRLLATKSSKERVAHKGSPSYLSLRHQISMGFNSGL